MFGMHRRCKRISRFGIKSFVPRVAHTDNDEKLVHFDGWICLGDEEVIIGGVFIEAMSMI
jgi:hypothetical protein